MGKLRQTLRLEKAAKESMLLTWFSFPYGFHCTSRKVLDKSNLLPNYARKPI